MNVIVVIDGREAIPVRAISMLTNWKVMSPDAVAKALAGDDLSFGFAGLCAYEIEGILTKQIPVSWWEEFAVRELNAISDEIKAKQVTHEAGYQKWRKQSLAALPAGVFVWKDEYLPLYERRHGAEALAHDLRRELTKSEKQARELNFAPFIRGFEIESLILEGFELEKAAVATQAPTVESNFTTASLVPVRACGDGSAPKSRRNRKPSWATVAMPYMRELYKKGSYKSAATFYKALIFKAGSEGSPFVKTPAGIFCTKAGTTVSDGSVGKAWPEIRTG